MFNSVLSTIIIASVLGLNTALGSMNGPQEKVLSSHQISLEDRQPDQFTNEVFRDNMLLNLAYMRGIIHSSKELKWEDIRKPFNYDLELAPRQTFAFHDAVLPEYQGQAIKTTNAHFNSTEGFKSDGYLIGDGVCHLASLISWSAKDASLLVKAPTNHDFAKIVGIDKQFGVAVYYKVGDKTTSQLQNLYITNNQTNMIKIRFEYDGVNLKVTVLGVL